MIMKMLWYKFYYYEQFIRTYSLCYYTFPIAMNRINSKGKLLKFKKPESSGIKALLIFT